MSRFRWWMAALASSCLAASGCSNTKANEKAKVPPPPEVYVTNPSFQEVTDYREFIGHTEAVNTVQVMARVTGYLDKVNFQDGDEVEAGKLLFQIDDRPYKAEYDRMAATLEQGKARLVPLINNYNRAVRLLAQNAIGREEYDRISGDFEEGKAAIGVYTASLDRAKLDLDFTQVIAPISGRLSRRMVDPGNLVKADESILTSIVSLDPMYAYFDIDERTLLELRRLIAQGKLKSRAQGAIIPVLIGLSDEPEANHPGTINFTDNKLITGTGTLQARGVIPNPTPRLLSPGLYIKVRLPVGTAHQSLMIEEQAIFSEQSNKSVYVVRNTFVPELDPKTKKEVKDPVTGKVKGAFADLAFAQTIKTGPQVKGLRVVTEGIVDGDRIVTTGLQRVKSGSAVRAVPTPRESGSPGKVTAVMTEPAVGPTSIPSLSPPIPPTVSKPGSEALK